MSAAWPVQLEEAAGAQEAAGLVLVLVLVHRGDLLVKRPYFRAFGETLVNLL